MAISGVTISCLSPGMLEHSTSWGSFIVLPAIERITMLQTLLPDFSSVVPLQVDSRYFSFGPVAPNLSASFGLIIEALLWSPMIAVGFLRSILCEDINEHDFAT